ncbi:helix-turn-helix transcriptional regulator [Naumannella sp. ID2617S]|nr:helix-turn-helix transcriptional regulator [Naumannella sp. ID2617S]
MSKRPTWERPTSVAINRTSYRLASLDDLRAAMVARGFTSGYQLARAAGISPATVNHLVFGRRSTASPQTVRAFREVLGRDVDGLFVLDNSTMHAQRVA